MTGVQTFFFFKQKTAYEIKECDWSSDVCSSDLLGRRAKDRDPFLGQSLGQFERRLATKLQNDPTRIFGFKNVQHIFFGQGFKIEPIRSEIGRASCRERV